MDDQACEKLCKSTLHSLLNIVANNPYLANTAIAVTFLAIFICAGIFMVLIWKCTQRIRSSTLSTAVRHLNKSQKEGHCHKAENENVPHALKKEHSEYVKGHKRQISHSNFSNILQLQPENVLKREKNPNKTLVSQGRKVTMQTDPSIITLYTFKKQCVDEDEDDQPLPPYHNDGTVSELFSLTKCKVENKKFKLKGANFSKEEPELPTMAEDE